MPRTHCAAVKRNGLVCLDNINKKKFCNKHKNTKNDVLDDKCLNNYYYNRIYKK